MCFFFWLPKIQILAEFYRSIRMRTVKNSGSKKWLRATPQRRAMLECLEREDRPLSVEEIHEYSQKILPKIGLRTVYRNIRELVEAGQLLGVDYAGQPTRYERVTGRNRPHFICRKCDRSFYLEEDTELPVTYTSGGFKVEWAEVILYGLCGREDCKETTRLKMEA